MGICTFCGYQLEVNDMHDRGECLSNLTLQVSLLTRERDEARERIENLKEMSDFLSEWKDDLKARLAAAEKVVEAARWWNADTCQPACGCSFCKSLAAYDAAKKQEPKP